MKAKIRWGTFSLGIVIVALGIGSCITGTFEMSNFGIYLEGTHARLSGAVLCIFGLGIMFTGVKRNV